MSRRLLATLLASALVVSACSGSEPEPEAAPEPAAATEEPVVEESSTPTVLAPLTGLPTDADLSERPALVVKIENSAPARPQSGLEQADLVFEELVEGGATRFITVFHSQLPDVAGPVRSARPIDVQVVSGLGERPALAYSGARQEVQAMLGGSAIVLLTEGQSGFYRESSRRAPHNLYVRVPDAVTAVAGAGATAPGSTAAFTFSDTPPSCPTGTPGCEEPGDAIEVAMSGASRTGFTYDPEAQRYRRFQNGEASTVTGAGRIGAANVVVLGAEVYRSGCCDTAGNPYDETDLDGEGRAIVLRDGLRYEARWVKNGERAPLELVDGDGNAFPLKPGPTWLLLPDASRLPSAPAA